MKNFTYNNNKFEIVSAIHINDVNIVIVKDDNQRYFYFKKVTINGKSYFYPFRQIMSVLPQYEKNQYYNIRNIMEAFIVVLNANNIKISLIKNALYEITSEEANAFSNNADIILEKQYYLKRFDKKLYHKDLANLLTLDESYKSEKKQSNYNISILKRILYGI